MIEMQQPVGTLTGSEVVKARLRMGMAVRLSDELRRNPDFDEESLLEYLRKEQAARWGRAMRGGREGLRGAIGRALRAVLSALQGL